MNKPKYIKVFNEKDLKLGIKSSLPKARSALALTILMSEVSSLQSQIEYSKSVDTEIKIADELYDQIFNSINHILEEYNITQDELIDTLNSNPLFKSQIESLIVALELIWKYARVGFVDNFSNSKERTGGNRYKKTLYLTTNADIIHNIVVSDIDEYYKILLNWIGLSLQIDDTLEKRLLSVLTVFSEGAVYKMINNDSDLIFNQEGIYESLLESDDFVSIKSDIEPKGALRILQKILTDNMNPYINYDSYNISMNIDSIETLKQYRDRVINYMKLTAKSVDTQYIECDSIGKLKYRTQLSSDFLHNRIIFGAPGTGKSYYLNLEKDKLLQYGGDFERVTFHEDYSYSQFVGSYRPNMKYSNDYKKDLSENDKETLSVLENSSLTAQDKYDELYEKFKNAGNLTRLPLLIGLYSDESFNTKKSDGSKSSDNNVVERNHGKSIRPLVNLLTENKKEEIVYNFTPGPFLRIYAKALKNAQSSNPVPHILIIEEINRAVVARVFGDVFQLLDRNSDNISEYSIESSEDIRKYLADELGGNPIDYAKLKIPDNLFIWATMNNADQGVKPMDTAFKRRWNFEYISLDEGETKISGKMITLGKESYRRDIEWNALRKAINNELSRYKLNEDKLLGPFFLSINLFEDEIINTPKFINIFKNKILMYLFEDVAKSKRKSLFHGAGDQFNSYSSILKTFDEKGIYLFSNNIIDELDESIVNE